ncbi:ethanolamine ammonia-lyase subunit EutC [Moritella sp. Urea-trap-13]|uniref:ethanolamine ammonia-lyase subunit EutC n=1 Tax=Moritella sp. Urea-trap-13 TaxID=2058327 RepID=UPI000C344D99|nr:ethanolamine ammonia-lyase subunit EutC [Moritella sp. Urea-trap-13]PKH07583.1 ethanolamine ammonia-lyase [Moritella sp. Urea-trap-13]
MSDLHELIAPQSDSVVTNPWRKLRRFTNARIGLGRVGNSIPSDELFKFQLAHAQAKDAVHTPLDIHLLCNDLTLMQTPVMLAEPLVLHSAVADRIMYLQRPDLGRQLNDISCQKLTDYQQMTQTEYDLVIVVADGLSSRAVQDHAVAVISLIALHLAADKTNSWTVAPIIVVEQGRVAIGDDIGELLHAKAVLVLIGERPGLSSPDSLGMYLTWAPKRGLDDSSRNCISNVRPEGLSYNEASLRAFYLLTEARRLSLSGVSLKDRSDTKVVETLQDTQNFLLSKTN